MENQEKIICPNCGAELPNESSFCFKCGTSINTVIQTDQTNSSDSQKKKKIITAVGIAIAVIVIAAVCFFVVNFVQSKSLKEQLMRDWQRIEGEDGTYITCILDFSDDEIEYRLETSYSWLNTTVATYDYKVVSGNQIKVRRYGNDYETFTVEFNDEKTMMIVQPALTSLEYQEYWFNLN